MIKINRLKQARLLDIVSQSGYIVSPLLYRIVNINLLTDSGDKHVIVEGVGEQDVVDWFIKNTPIVGCSDVCDSFESFAEQQGFDVEVQKYRVHKDEKTAYVGTLTDIWKWAKDEGMLTNYLNSPSVGEWPANAPYFHD